MASWSRRELLRRGLGLAGASALAGCGLPSPWPPAPAVKVARIGWLSGSAGTEPDRAAALRQGLWELGYVEGQHYTLEHRFLEGEAALLPSLASELLALPVDMLLTSGGGTEVAHQLTSTIPIVMVYPGDPVANGLVASLARPGGNITGLTTFDRQLGPKRLEQLKDAVPGLRRVALMKAGLGAPPEDVNILRNAAQTLRIELQELAVGQPAELDAAFNEATSARADAILWAAGVNSRGEAYRTPVLALAAQYRLPVVCGFLEWVQAGALFAYGTNLPALFRRAATYVDKILKGTKPADLPVEQPVQFDFVVNQRTAEALGLWPLPESVRIQVTEVIQ